MSRPDEQPPDPATDDSPPSKSQRKRDMHALQDLGEALIALDLGKLAQLDLPERLVDAITAARKVTAHEGRRRQLQYVGKLMRDIDPAPVQAALQAWTAGVPPDQAQFAAAEKWREELLRDDTAIARFVAEHPGADAAVLASLVRDARAERARGSPPHRFRELFRTLRASIDRAGDESPAP